MRQGSPLPTAPVKLTVRRAPVKRVRQPQLGGEMSADSNPNATEEMLYKYGV